MIANRLPVVTQDNDYDEAPGFDRMGRNLDVEGGYGSPYATAHRQRDFLRGLGD